MPRTRNPYVQVLRLLERFEMEVLHLAIKDALHMGLHAKVPVVAFPGR